MPPPQGTTNKKTYPLEQSLEILEEGRGSHFDPNLLDRFFQMASKLHSQIAGDDSPRVRTAVAEFIDRYFPNDQAQDVGG